MRGRSNVNEPLKMCLSKLTTTINYFINAEDKGLPIAGADILINQLEFHCWTIVFTPLYL